MEVENPNLKMGRGKVFAGDQFETFFCPFDANLKLHFSWKEKKSKIAIA